MLTKTMHELPVNAMPERTQKGMASWAGTGPWGKQCGNCKYADELNERSGKLRCLKAKELVKGLPTKIKQTTPCCRYFST